MKLSSSLPKLNLSNIVKGSQKWAQIKGLLARFPDAQKPFQIAFLLRLLPDTPFEETACSLTLRILYAALQMRLAITEPGRAVAFSLRDDLILALGTRRCQLEHFIEKSLTTSWYLVF